MLSVFKSVVMAKSLLAQLVIVWRLVSWECKICLRMDMVLGGKFGGREWLVKFGYVFVGECGWWSLVVDRFVASTMYEHWWL